MVRSHWYASEDAGLRLRARLGRGRLRDLGISNLTLKRYQEAVEAFIGWQLLWFRGVAGTVEQLDDHLSVYVEYLWESGDGRSKASQTLAGCQHFLLRRRAFPQAWSLCRIWGSFELPQRTPPIPMQVLLALAGVAIAENRFEFAAGLLVGFRGFLRTGELLQCRFAHIALRPGGHVVIALPLTKIGARRGQQEVVAFQCPITCRLLTLAAFDRAPGETILGCGISAFRAWWNQGIRKLLLDPNVLRPYSLRRGGATWTLQQSGNMELVLFRGRWSSSTAARGYLQEGMALLAQAALTPEARGTLLLYHDVLRRAV